MGRAIQRHPQRARRIPGRALGLARIAAFCHPKPAPRAILVSLDLEGCFDRVSRRHCVAALARADFPSHWVRVVNNWLRDRRARATWNGQLSKPRVLTEGLPQGSPCSPILMAIAYADLPGRVKAAVPEAQVVQFADDLRRLLALAEARSGRRFRGP